MKKMLTALFMAGTLFLAISTAHATTVDITAIFGSGNPNSGWTAFDGGGTQIGLRGKNSSTGATTNDGAGNYTFAPGTPWNLEISYNSGTANLSAYNYVFNVSGPGIIVGGPIPASFYIDNSYGTNATLNGAGVEGTFASLAGTNNVMQLSQKITFFPFGSSFDNLGTYTISTQILSGTTLVNSGSINVNVGTASVPDGGISGALLGIGLLALAALKKVGVLAALA